MAKSVTVPLFKDTVPIHYYTSVQTKELHEDYYQHFYSKLNYNQSLHRIILQRSTQKMLRLGQWSRVDLCLVNEMGLPSCQDTETNIHVQLACKLIIRRHRTYIDSPLYEVGMQPLHDDAWGDNQRSQQSSIGFIKSNHGGFEYCIRRNAAADSNQPLGDVYLYISQAPSGPSSVTCNVLPLVIGPLIVDEEEIIYQDTCKAPVSMWSDVVSKRVAHPVVKSVRNGFWDQKQETSRTYRVYPILSGLKHHQEQYFLMEENWKSGMPGKIWDGALVITDIFAKRLAKNPTFLDNAHVLDLSAG
ncbi:Cytochrome oxidase assembly factor 4 [Umbelopsis nana]